MTEKQNSNGKYHSGCLICGKPLIYEEKSRMHICAVCGETFESNAVCEEGHFVCDRCHGSGLSDVLAVLRSSEERNPEKLFLDIAKLPSVHMHGPEHHSIVPCVLLTAYRNNGGNIHLDDALREAVRRGRQVPGGFCGFWGVCGAAAGAGIYASILLESGPLNAERWPIPQKLTARCLENIASLGGPRCCKRTVRTAIKTAVEFTKEQTGIEMPSGGEACSFSSENRECLRGKCPFYGKRG